LSDWTTAVNSGPDGSFSNIVKDEEDYFIILKFYATKSIESKLNAFCSIRTRFEAVEYIYDKFFDLSRNVKLPSIQLQSKYAVLSTDSNNNLPMAWTYENTVPIALPAWSEQFNNELKPLSLLSEKCDFDAIFNIDKNWESNMNFFSGNVFARRLIVAKLVKSDEVDKLYLEFVRLYDDVIKNGTNESEKQRAINKLTSLNNLKPFLDELDVGRYLKERPWINDQKLKSKKSEAESVDAIVLHRVSMFVFDRTVSQDELKACFGADEIDKAGENTVGAISEMSLSEDNIISVLSWNKTMIGLMSNPLQYEEFDISRASIGGSAFRFMIDETSMTYSYDYYVAGELVSSQLVINNEIIEEQHKDSFKNGKKNIEETIHALFKKVGGRSLKDIDMKEMAERWKLSVNPTA